mmetsp:Transcript_137589/g.343360  ORF Transcript_137589/g.343360 Transcript_137589/m.343360 type:complete len:222 (+) Transcript_137589:632-1297(+)
MAFQVLKGLAPRRPLPMVRMPLLQIAHHLLQKAAPRSPRSPGSKPTRRSQATTAARALRCGATRGEVARSASSIKLLRLQTPLQTCRHPARAQPALAAMLALAAAARAAGPIGGPRGLRRHRRGSGGSATAAASHRTTVGASQWAVAAGAAAVVGTWSCILVAATRGSRRRMTLGIAGRAVPRFQPCFTGPLRALVVAAAVALVEQLGLLAAAVAVGRLPV